MISSDPKAAKSSFGVESEDIEDSVSSEVWDSSPVRPT